MKEKLLNLCLTEKPMKFFVNFLHFDFKSLLLIKFISLIYTYRVHYQSIGNG